MNVNFVSINQRVVPESSCASFKRASNPTVAANADDFLMAGPKSANWSYADLAASERFWRIYGWLRTVRDE